MRATCDLSRWLAATSNNSSPRRVVVVDAWPHVGIGHSMRAAALWLQLVSRLATTSSPSSSARSLRFAVCVPARLRAAFSEEYHEAPACNRRVFDPITRRNVSAVQFATHEHISFAGLENLRASRMDFLSIRQRPPPLQSCSDLTERLLSKRRVVVFYGLRVRELLQTCAERCLAAAAGSGSAKPFGCLRHMHLTAPPARPLPICDIGLHLRSMKLDDKSCDLLSSSTTADPADEAAPERCRFAWRQRRCPSQPLSKAIACSGGERFATADSPSLYAATRAAGWRDFGETASVTWNERAITPYPVQLGDVAATAAAFVTLARCRQAIVAPVISHFSETAALAAGVPLFGCCSELAQGV